MWAPAILSLLCFLVVPTSSPAQVVDPLRNDGSRKSTAEKQAEENRNSANRREAEKERQRKASGVKPIYNDEEPVKKRTTEYTRPLGCLKGDCKNGEGVWNYENHLTYTGKFLDGYPSGWGKLEDFSVNGYTVTASYTGNWLAGFKHGKGKEWKYAGIGKTDSYEGEYVLGEFEGQGTRIYPNGNSYIGNWKAGKRSGTGSFTYRNGSYMGEWLNDMRHGMGKDTGPDEIYEGMFAADYKEGAGVSYDYAGKIKLFEGTFKKGKRHGKGKEWTIESIYEGKWVAGEMDGAIMVYNKDGSLRGKEVHVNGIAQPPGKLMPVVVRDTAHEARILAADHTIMNSTKLYPLYKGKIKDGVRSGTGIAYYDGSYDTLYYGQWANDRYEGKGIEFYPDNRRQYAGDFVNGYPDGKGTYYSLLEDKSFFIGSFSEGAIVEGILYHVDGSLFYDGPWKYNYPTGCIGNCENGIGTRYANDGEKKYTGQWKNGQITGLGKEYEGHQLMYEGEFNNGIRQGGGTMYDTEGAHHFIGKFVNGKKEGKGVLYYGDEEKGFTPVSGVWKNDAKVK
jgi:hypothetical protein